MDVPKNAKKPAYARKKSESDKIKAITNSSNM